MQKQLNVMMKMNDAAIRQAFKPRRRWRWWKCKPLAALIYAFTTLVFGVITWAWVLAGVVK